MIAIMQPTFNSWLGYYDLIDKCELFVFYDDVQLTKRSWQVRNRILTSNGELFLTIPILNIGHRDDIKINNAQINYNEKWINKHLKSLDLAYKKAPFYGEVYAIIENLYNKKYDKLSELNISFITEISQKIGIQSEFICSSSLKGITGSKDERLVAICKNLNAVEYLSPQGSASYIEEFSPGGEFTKNFIELYYHNYEHPTYPQYGNLDFLPYMGIFDLLFNVGFTNALEVIISGRRKDYHYSNFRQIKTQVNNINNNE